VLRLTGIAVSQGLAWGPAALLLQRHVAVRYAIAAGRVEKEMARLDQAREATARQLHTIHARVSQAAGADLASLFEAQLLMLDDHMLVPRARSIIGVDRVNAEWAIDRAFDEFCEVFVDVGDAYLRERRGDVADVVGRLRRNLLPASAGAGRLLVDLDAPAILVADDLAPSVAAHLDRGVILGLAIETGSRTHHTAILARSLGLPAVAGVAGATKRVRPGTLILVDGYAGEVVIDPSPALIEEARERRERLNARSAAVRVGQHGPAVSVDGVAIQFQANVERLDEIEFARAAGAEGVGLFRSEFMLGSQAIDAFDEERQFRIYRDLVERMAPFPVTVRTFDIDESQISGGGDDGLEREGAERSGRSRGPLGLRAIRLSLGRRDLLETQLRALVRAGRYGSVRVLFPFVSAVDELREAKAVLAAAARAVAADGREAAAMPVGVMIEVPSAALTVDLLADEADFFSIGTNDLIQYCLAVDRTDGRVAGLFDPLHPAILRVIRHVIRTARRCGRRAAVCGEMAGDPGALLLLLGLGVTDLSMNPAAIPAARALVRQVRLSDVRRVAARAIRLPTSRDITTMLADEFPAFAPRTGVLNGRSHREGER
jgi:phosphotransferase system enzyme I (PtsI)